MKIGLVRHFKVRATYPDRISSKEYIDWLDLYDELDIDPIDVDLKDIEWNKCYSSSLPRAYKTARLIYAGKVVKSDKIREVNLRFRKDLDGLDSVINWGDLSTEHWRKSTGKSGEDKEETEERVASFLDDLESETEKSDNVLIVCHELIMTVLESELRKRGFLGEKTLGADNGELFILEDKYS